MTETGEYRLKRKGQPMVLAKITLQETDAEPKVIWKYDKAWYYKCFCSEVEVFLAKQLTSLSEKKKSLIVEEIKCEEPFSVTLVLEVLAEAISRCGEAKQQSIHQP